jgi:glutamine---fructose-6-phosphate transaminase (isomerizing)
MCGIVGYIGSKEAKPILLDCLSRLEYRGYDSSGVAVLDNDIKVCKDKVRVGVLQEKSPRIMGTLGIAHTRWATHGPPSLVNAHPHLDCSGKFAVVHNGVISNYQALRQQLTAEGHKFVSETDTEVIPHLIEKYYQGKVENAVEVAISKLEGSYAIVVLSQDESKLVVARKDSPLVLGIGENETFIASDVPAIICYTSKVIYLEDGDLGVITRDSLKITRDGKETKRITQQISWGREDIQKAGYEHFMLKEIHEQPRVIRDTLTENGWLNSNASIGKSVEDLSILACGTSYHAGLIGEYLVQELLGIPTKVAIGSEFNHRRTIYPDQTIVISQSGETADVLSAMKKLQAAGVKMLAITNVPGSTASRLADCAIYTKAGPEVSVAATKSFIAQLIALYQLTLSHPAVELPMRDQLISDLRTLPSTVERVFELETQIMDCARHMSKCENAFFVGRGINYPIALEGALKLKEISYIHAEGYAAGELKHGPFALLYEGVPVVAIVAMDANHDSMVTSIKEIKARNAFVTALVDENDDTLDNLVDLTLKVPHTHTLLSPVVNTVPLQLLAYYAAKMRGCPIDFPRNLAKSVTVE